MICVFVAGWRHALRSEWPFIIIIIRAINNNNNRRLVTLEQLEQYKSPLQCLAEAQTDTEYTVLGKRKLHLFFAPCRDSVSRGKPFFIQLAPATPHLEFFPSPGHTKGRPPQGVWGAPRPAARHVGWYSDVTLPLFANFNKPWQGLCLGKPRNLGMMTATYQARLQSVTTIDDMIGSISESRVGRGGQHSGHHSQGVRGRGGGAGGNSFIDDVVGSISESQGCVWGTLHGTFVTYFAQ